MLITLKTLTLDGETEEDKEGNHCLISPCFCRALERIVPTFKPIVCAIVLPPDFLSHSFFRFIEALQSSSTR